MAMASFASSQGADLGEFNPNESVSIGEIYIAQNGTEVTSDDDSLRDFLREGNWLPPPDDTDIIANASAVDVNNVVTEVRDLHAEIVPGIPTDDRASSVHSDEDKVLSAHGGGEENEPTVDSPQFLSEDDKPEFYKSFTKPGSTPRRFTRLSLTLPNPEKLGISGDGKSEDMFKKIDKRLTDPDFSKKKNPRSLKNCVIVKEVVGGAAVLRMAFEVVTNANAKVTLHSFLKMLYEDVFPGYNYRVQVHDDGCYKSWFRELVAPLEAREGVDTEPLVRGDGDSRGSREEGREGRAETYETYGLVGRLNN